MPTNNPRSEFSLGWRRRFTLLIVTICCAVNCAALLGCYDAKALVEARRAVAVRARLEEVDLGEFRITLPGPYTERKRAEIHFRAFGQVANRDLKLVQETLEKNGPDLQNRLLLVVRQMKMQEIQEPSLDTLRGSIASAINDTLPGDPLQSVGFYSFGFVNL
jgi:hypothetical protein